MDSSSQQKAALTTRIREFIDSSLTLNPSEPFGQLALDIYAWQSKADPQLQRLASQHPTQWMDIPPVPVGLFKHIPIGATPPQKARLSFRTSGTTQSQPGTVYLESADLYNYGALEWAKHCLPNPPSRILGLLESPRDAPYSSLSHMVELFPQFSQPEGSVDYFVQSGTLLVDELTRILSASSEPVFVACTSFSILKWLESHPSPLPPGSTVMITGGFKGLDTHLSNSALYEEVQRRLHPSHIATEYGMTELCSQLWGTPTNAYSSPPWLQIVIVDAESGQPVPTDQEGQIRFYDLCNLDTVIGIETLDYGYLDDSGGLHLIGRLPGAPLRGCTLPHETLIQGEKS